MFNPQARWDRKLPADRDKDCRAVEVVASFRKGRIVPLYFFLDQDRFEVSRVNYSWTERKGRGLVYYFSVRDKGGDYRLLLDAESMVWRMIPPG